MDYRLGQINNNRQVMKKTTILSIVVLLIVSVSSISYSVLLHKENRALIAKQDSLYTLSEAQMVF